jgi:Family of unknown function (DUF6516)
MSRDDPLSYLQDLDGEILVQEGGYWVKIEARTCMASPQKPHGISYSLTLHDASGERVLGFDNAHAPPKERKGFTARRVEYDHWHPDGRTIEAYEFTDAGKLLEDFFGAVDRVLTDKGVI